MNKAIQLVTVGLLAGAITASVFPMNTLAEQKTLSAQLSASPSLSVAVNQKVGLTATVSGSETGPVKYSFDCTNDGTWEKQTDTGNSTFTADNLCSYAEPGDYTAKVLVTRGDASYQGRLTISVFRALIIEKNARNITAGEQSFTSSPVAKPGDKLAFEITIVNQTQETAQNMRVQDILPSQLWNTQNLRIDNVSVAGTIENGIPAGVLAPTKEKKITFEAQITGADTFGTGTTTITNKAQVSGTGIAQQTASLGIIVNKGSVLGIATSVSTGAFNPLFVSIVISILLFFLMSYALLLKFYVRSYVLPNIWRVKAERDLEKALRNARKNK